ncbi:MAG TPA: acyloxyacyl hydrolase [Bacteroidales bacterium]|nr:acyloxyacyl hydrolase [Bacteroidales bacterium]
MKRALFYITLFLISASRANCQEAGDPLSAGFRIHSGLNLPVYNALDYLVDEGINAVDLFYQRQSTGNHFQDELWNYPATGAGYSYWSTGNNEVFGKAHVLYADIQVPLTNADHIVNFGTRTSAGIAYFTRSFDVENNNLNRAIGSHLNIYMNLSAYCKIRIIKGFEAVLDGGLVHFSNGKTRSPNYGINAATVSAGLMYNFSSGIKYKSFPEMPPVPGRYFHSVLLSGGRKVYDDLSGEKFLSTTVSYGLDRYLTRSGKAGFGADIFYDGSIKKGLEEKGLAGTGFSEQLRMGVHASYSLCYKKTVAGVQLGYYLYSKFTVLTRMYTRISLNYILTDNISAGFSIRSHFGKADALEYGIIYTW